MKSKIVCSLIASFLLTGAVARCQQRKQENPGKPDHSSVPGGIIVAIAGAIIYFEGLKREIIAALKDEPGKREAGPAGGDNPQA